MGKLFGPQDELADQKAKILLEQVNPFSGSMDLHELVRRVREGDAAKWQTTAEEMFGVAAGNEEAANAGREMLQSLESSWSGEGADAASQAIGSSIKVTQDAADIYQRNSDHLGTNSGQFEDIKNRLPDVPAKEPETGAWDTITPWDTDAEDAANKYKADVEAARSMYSGYEGNIHRSAYDMQADFGQMKDLGGDFGSMERGGSDSGSDSGSGVIDIPGSGEGGDTSRPGGYDGSVGGGPERGGTSVPPGGGYQSPTGPNSPNDNTGTSGYTPPSTVTPPAANYPSPNAPGGAPGNTGFGPNGGGPGTGFGPTGFGPRGTPGTSGFGPGGSSSGGAGGRFSAPGMGRAGGYSGGAGGYSGAGAGGGGGAPGSGAAPGSGKMTGASPGGFGPTGSGGAAAAGGGSGAGAGGRGGGMMGGMGGAGRGGQGGDDEEHQRKYLADTDEAFTLTDEGEVLRDPVTGHVVTPPTIGE
ncbi:MULTISPECIES: hypothetical protein [Prauserella salsuginis group]|uniref:PPE family protein n=1 Tax=Prauserella salsuginis TaxID=387889 RepID=A0ABW6G233_9PSEU|nr:MULTISPECIES: hypothetical protein [Prauserella salsuginis group]MCR3719973.1 hypothetical protein [Prauserella flava]MCR3736483.1 hypothetical protein [Prauserella salsuginis]